MKRSVHLELLIRVLGTSERLSIYHVMWLWMPPEWLIKIDGKNGIITLHI